MSDKLTMYPIEVAIRIALSSDRLMNDEYVFNLLARAIPNVGRWTVPNDNSMLIERRLILMKTFGYTVVLRSFVGATRDYRYIAWLKHGHYHRNDIPAIQYEDGQEVWYKNGTIITRTRDVIFFIQT